MGTSRTKVTTRRPGEPDWKELSRAHGVVLEEIRSQMNAVLEAVQGSEQRLERKIDSLDAHLSQRISVLEQVVRQNTEDIRTLRGEMTELRGEVAGLRAEVHELRDEVARLRHDFDHREGSGRDAALEARVAVIEARLGIVGPREPRGRRGV
jgi:predicted RNase H-like nuclease (RuvC/YqgF family)